MTHREVRGPQSSEETGGASSSPEEGSQSQDGELPGIEHGPTTGQAPLTDEETGSEVNLPKVTPLRV